MAGLGARDTLRLEAGLCLYGNDIDQDTLPPSAVLLFTVPKKRRADNNFPGCSQIVKQQKDKPATKRVGFIFEDGKAPPRAGATIMLDGDTIGSVTSGKIHNFFILKILLFFRGTIAKCRSKYWYGICSIRICQTWNWTSSKSEKESIFCNRCQNAFCTMHLLFQKINFTSILFHRNHNSRESVCFHLNEW